MTPATDRLHHLGLPHHAGVFVFENVAVEHADAIEALHQLDPHRFARPQVDGIAPGPVRFRRDLAADFALDQLKLCTVNMERVVHIGFVGDLPQLDLVDAAHRVDALHVELPAVDEEFHAVPPAGRSSNPPSVPTSVRLAPGRLPVGPEFSRRARQQGQLHRRRDQRCPEQAGLPAGIGQFDDVADCCACGQCVDRGKFGRHCWRHVHGMSAAGDKAQ